MKKTIDNYSMQNGFLIINKKLTKAIGLDRAAVLTELMNEYTYSKENNILFEGSWFYYNYEKFNQIGLKRKRIDSIINFLLRMGFIEIKNAGIPKRIYFKLNKEEIVNFIEGKLYF
jgi:hypothetical protein